LNTALIACAVISGDMNCANCGAQLPDDAAFCYKCGSRTNQGAGMGQQAGAPIASQSGGPAPAAASPPNQVVAPSGATSLKCPTCGAPLAPKFGEMVITCAYCGGSVTLGDRGWADIQKQTMLALKISTDDQANSIIKPMMDKGSCTGTFRRTPSWRR